MDDRRMLLHMEGHDALEKLLQTRDGDAALLYAFVALHPSCSAEAAAAELGWDETRTGRARGLLLAYGLVSDGSSPPARGETTYAPAELTAARDTDAAFGGLCSYLESSLGRILRKGEMETLLGVYETLNLSPDVLVLLISFCRDENQLSARNLERWAYRWHDQGLVTFAQAESWLEEWRLRNDRYGRILRIFGHDRRPSDAEKNYMDDWIRRGVTPDLVRAAYDEMTSCIGRFNWAYINKVLISWLSEGIRTPQQAKARDKQRPSHTPAKQESAEAVILRHMTEKRTERDKTINGRLDELRRLSPEFTELERDLRLSSSCIARSQGAAREEARAEHARLLTRRTGILRAYGKPENWLENKPDCPICGDRGYIGTKKCECLIRALAAQAETPPA